jgi:hypothetical protein
VGPLFAALPVGAEHARLKGFESEIAFFRVRPAPAPSIAASA